MVMRFILFLFLFSAVLASSLGLGFAQEPVVKPGDIVKLPPGGTGGLVQTYSQFGHIVGVETGGKDHAISVKLDAPVVTGSLIGPPCKTTNAGYTLDPEAEGARFHEAVLLSAFLAGKKVRVLIEGCFKDKPLIIAVGIGAPVD
jgi:hypothetical protein